MEVSKIFVLDFGSQYTQLIAKKIRRLGYSAEVVSGRTSWAELQEKKPKGIIFSGSPASVGSIVDPDLAYLSCKVPLLGLCFGYQFIASHLGGKVESQTHREYGPAMIEKTADGVKDPLVKNLSAKSRAWMSHGDSVTAIPPDAKKILESKGKIAGFSMPNHKIWALQFHPEVFHTDEGDKIFESFAQDICGLSPDWKLGKVLEHVNADLKKQLHGIDEVLCAVSGGVDSTVMAVLLAQHVTVHAYYVDHGFQRNYDLKDLEHIFSKYPKIKLEVINAQEAFWKELKGVSDPETKRKIIGKLFIETFAAKTSFHDGKRRLLGQGTIYSDVIESAANDLAPSQKIKSHHNVGGLPENIQFELCEPLRFFFKDEVREIGALLGIEKSFLDRHPFPGPGLSIRCLGELQPERVEILKKCDAILHDELIKRNLYSKTWQAFVAIMPGRAVGVMGDGRSYESIVCIRCVSSSDAMTVEATEFPWHDLKEIASRIVNEVKGVNRVLYDLTSKPPGTIEFE